MKTNFRGEYFGLRMENEQENRGNCIMWSFIICIPHKVKENEISGT
jgi:hypothetical protein